MSVTPDAAAAPGFAGFRPAAFAFLRGLAAHQTRDWFEAHRADHETEVRAPMAALLVALSAELARRGLPLRGDPQRSAFRIHRDVRFSRDKRPYKTHAGATLTRDGRKMSQGLLYVHVDPEGSFVAAGFHQPAPGELQAIREAIVAAPDMFRGMVDALARAGLDFGPDEDGLRRPPRGFAHVADPDLQAALRRKSFIVRRALPQAALGRPALVATIADVAEAALPLLRFGWAALDD